jgi:ligand-binding sensor domain-containing protein
MSSNFIESWNPKHTNDGIVGFTESQVLEPESIYPGWMNLVAQRSVRAIAIAPKSRHLWMATWGGVLSWRQREESAYYRYSSEHGMAGNAVASLCIDESERPWVGHEEGGLSYFDGQRWRSHEHFRKEPIRALSNTGSAESIWVATNNGVYSVYIDGSGRVPIPMAVNQEGCARAVVILPDGDDLLLGNRTGLFRLRLGADPVRLAADMVSSCVALARDGSQRIWIGTPHGVYPMAAGDVVGDPVYEGQLGCVKAIAAGQERIWILSADGISQASDGDWQPISLPSEEMDAASLHAIAASSNDNHLWVGTDRVLSSLYYSAEGVVQWDHEMLPTHAEDELSNLGRCAVASDVDDKVWIGTAGGLVTGEQDDKWSVDPIKGDVHALCVADGDLAQGAAETVWLLTSPDGISSLGPNASPPPGLPLALATGADRCAYALTTKGVWRLGNNLTKVAEAAPQSVHALAQTPDGRWWVGTTQGVYQYMGGKWQPVSEAPGPQLAEVYALAVIRKQVWAATSAGLWVRAQNKWVSHNKQEPLLVRTLAPASGESKLWLARLDGVVRYDAVSRTVDREYTPFEHGLASCRVTALVESKGKLWIVTQVGISRVKLTEGD